MRHYLELGRGGREAVGEWKGREGGGNGGPGYRRSWRSGRRAWRRARAGVTPRPLYCSGSGTGRCEGYTRLCRVMDQGAALPRQDRWRGRALPRQRSVLLVAATSALCRATMHGAVQAFGRARVIGAAKSVSLKKTDSVRFKIIFKKWLKLKKFPN